MNEFKDVEEKCCSNCIHYTSDEEDNNCLCNVCKYNYVPGSDEYDKYNLMWNQKPEMVDHPNHYKKCSLECIDVMEVMFGKTTTTLFAILNAFTYLWRYKNKNGEEDLNKAKWYLDYADKNKSFLEYEHEEQQLKRLIVLHKNLTGDEDE